MSDQPQQQPPAVQFWQPPPQNSYSIDNAVPARVALAADVAYMMARRKYPQIAVNDIQIHAEPAPAMTQCEEAAHDAACQLLVQYFDGCFGIDMHEAIRVDAIRVETDRRRIGDVFDCGRCKGSGRDPAGTGECNLCKGSGQVLVLAHSREIKNDDDKSKS